MTLARTTSAIVALMLLMCACGSPDPEIALAPTAATPPAVATASPAITPTPTPTPTATPSPSASPAVAEPTPTASLTSSVIGDEVGIHDMRELTWVSSLIVHGTVAEKLPSQRFPAIDGPLGTMTPQDYYDLNIYTDFVIDVDQVFRGTAVDHITLRQQGGRVGDAELDASANNPDLHPGDDLVLFLTPDSPEHPGDAFWSIGSQGIWLPDGDEYAQYHGLISPLDLAGIGQAVADALKQEPPEHPPLDLVSLEESPPGPDLP